jgi:2-polyprenyl-3-methyl-5-hydroxy-6-metoxy-1,4-benzoquinol methylase
MTILDSIKDYWNNQPCNILHGKSEVGTKNWYNEIREKRYFVEPHLYPFPEFIKWKNKNVLEIGCGLGIDAMEVAKHGANYTGIDISDVSVNLAKRGFELFGLHGELLQLDAMDLPNFNKKFDY